ncbi:hypothetical protein BV898_02608 [Hypsibius exemplaris]|uniref:Uncharacterized protein n=1 Tax=Hypsibius exemplaris TaxID=2072580 RepID=A0A1W0X889_HYPEX|nr:hypothetical protein BV898_02608 [Hypsibius exemplaris]
MSEEAMVRLINRSAMGESVVDGEASAGGDPDQMELVNAEEGHDKVVKVHVCKTEVASRYPVRICRGLDGIGTPGMGMAQHDGRSVTAGVGYHNRTPEGPPFRKPPATSGMADLPGVRLWYSDTGGDGPTVVLSHAHSGVPTFGDVDLHNLVVTFLGVDKFHLVGVAAGGGIAVDYALSHPSG